MQMYSFSKKVVAVGANRANHAVPYIILGNAAIAKSSFWKKGGRVQPADFRLPECLKIDLGFWLQVQLLKTCVISFLAKCVTAYDAQCHMCRSHLP